MKRLAASITGVVLLSILPQLALSAIGGLNTGGECQGVPLPARGTVSDEYRNALEMQNRFETGSAECSRLGGVYVPAPILITDEHQPVYTRERAIKDYRQAMSDWRSSDSCDKLAAKMQLVGATIMMASGLAMIANPQVGAIGLVLGYSVTVQGIIVGTWVCTDG